MSDSENVTEAKEKRQFVSKRKRKAPKLFEAKVPIHEFIKSISVLFDLL
jgi:hypothetical protein